MKGSRFLSELVVRLHKPWANDGVGLWLQEEPLQFYSHRLKKTITAEYGFAHDFASVPRLPVIYSTFGNRYHRSAVIHDWLCRMRAVRREIADKVFLDAMRAENEEAVADMREAGIDDDEILDFKARAEGRAQAMYAAVVMYSKTGAWKKEFDRPGYEPIE